MRFSWPNHPQINLGSLLLDSLSISIDPAFLRSRRMPSDLAGAILDAVALSKQFAVVNAGGAQ